MLETLGFGEVTPTSPMYGPTRALARQVLAPELKWDGKLRLFVASYDTKPIGFANVCMDPDKDDVDLRLLGVNRDYRGHGIGGMLLEHTVQVCREQGFAVMRTTPASDRSAKFFTSHDFYRSAGQVELRRNLITSW